MLITPARSENNPPRAAKINGVAVRIVEKSNMTRNVGVNKSLIVALNNI
jgi:hypothetical protein